MAMPQLSLHCRTKLTRIIQMRMDTRKCVEGNMRLTGRVVTSHIQQYVMSNIWVETFSPLSF